MHSGGGCQVSGPATGPASGRAAVAGFLGLVRSAWMAVESIGRRVEVEFVPVAGGDHGFVGVFAEAGKQIEDGEKAKAHALTVKYRSANGESVWCRGGVNFSIRRSAFFARCSIEFDGQEWNASSHAALLAARPGLLNRVQQHTFPSNAAICETKNRAVIT